MSPRILAGCFLSLLFASLTFAEPPEVAPREIDGRWWLSQTAAARQRFVQGWTDGYTNGWLSAQGRLLAAAQEAHGLVPPERSLAAALLVSATVLQDANPEYRKPQAYYADQVTTFYTAYTDLRRCPVALVLKGLDGRGSLTLEEIAQWLREAWAR